MAELLFKLNGVPQDEADEVRELLEKHEIGFYETSQGNWGVSLGAIWLPDASQKIEAEELLAAYQQQRSQVSRENYELGNKVSMAQRLFANPLKGLGYLLAIGVLLYISIVPLLSAWN